jgi:hypothetical protein
MGAGDPATHAVYIVTEHCVGGDLLTLLQACDVIVTSSCHHRDVTVESSHGDLLTLMQACDVTVMSP